MKLTVAVKLNPTQKQARALRETLERANDAANYISEYAWQQQTFGQWILHKALYYNLRDRFTLPAQITVRVIAKVADAYKLDKKRQRIFKPHGSIAFDDRILHWYVPKQEVSISVLGSREHIPFVCDGRALDMLQSQQGESDLVYRNGNFFLFATVNVEELPPGETKGWLGVDLGIVSLAFDSEGHSYSGKPVTGLRKRNNRLRAKLQSKGTRGTKRLLVKRRRKEARFAKHINHCISKQLVQTAKALSYGIALEELKGIRERATFHAGQRYTLHSWAFHQLRQFVTYKAALCGVPTQAIDPRNTSRECSQCGYTDKANRPTQSRFLCKLCGYSAIADYNAACNIASRAACKPAVLLGTSVTHKGVQSQVLGQSPRL